MIGMRMGQQQGVDLMCAGIEQLLAQVGAAVDQHALPAASDQQRAAPPPVAWLGRVAAAPFRTDRRDAPGRAAAEQCDLHAAGRPALANSRKKLSLVTAASSSGGMPFSAATAAAVTA